MPRISAARLRDHLLVPAMVLAISLNQWSNGDISEVAWMSREGAALLDGSPMIHADRWSWAPQAWPFVPTSPAWQYLSAWAVDVFGYYGPNVLAFLTAAGCLWLVARTAFGFGATPTAVTLSLTFAFLISGGILTARAGLPAFALFIAALSMVSRLSAMGSGLSSRRLLLTVLTLDLAVSFAGIWLHQSWATFAPALAALQLPLMHGRFPTSRLLTLFPAGLVATTLGVLAGPTGAQVWPQTLEVAAACRGLVKEWTTPWQNGPVWIGIWLICLFLLFFIGRHLLRARIGITSLPFVLFGVAAIAVFAGATAVRFILLGVYAMAPLLAMALSGRKPGSRFMQLRTRLGERLTEPYWRNVVSLLMLPLIPLAVFQAAAKSVSPDRAFSTLPTDCRLFATDSTAKFVEFYRPDVRVWVDGRQHYWGRERLLLAQRYLNGEAAQMLPSGTSCVMLEKKQAPGLRKKLAKDLSWSRVGRTKQYDVWARTVPLP